MRERERERERERGAIEREINVLVHGAAVQSHLTADYFLMPRFDIFF